ncbi:hypothetical protein C0991_009934 [Blastosporella zonata]|nr:hypothetical protein C0991_009934 [Blastosporella zonata]
MGAGFLLEYSNTATYWFNQDTMQNFVDKILAPYFEAQKCKLHLPPSQKSLWSIDVWSVHRSLSFRTWMKTHHPNIVLDFVPGGCTGVLQPCNVGIQRPFKLSLKQSYHEDIVNEMSEQMGHDDPLTVDDCIATMHNRTPRWLWNAYNSINNKELVKKQAFEMCTIRNWDLSYECLTGYKIQSCLRELKETDPQFWSELTCGSSGVVVPNAQQKDPASLEDDFSDIEEGGDDSDIPLDVLINSMTSKPQIDGIAGRENGALEADRDAEDLEEALEDSGKSMGRGKRVRRSNKLYTSAHFWRHYDGDASDAEE